MFIDDTTDKTALITKNSFTIIVGNLLPQDFSVPKTSTFILSPDEKEKIPVEAVRGFFENTSKKQTSDVYLFIVTPESMNAEAQNAILKHLEEPHDFYHIIFLTKKPSLLLTTIMSRAAIYFLRSGNSLDAPLTSSEKTIDYAKKLLTIKPKDLPALAKEISDKKDRNLALDIVSTAIEISYKSYFKTNNILYLKKLPNLLRLYENLNQNGHIKLHFLADMV